MRSAQRRKVNVFETKYLRILVIVSRIDRVRNEEWIKHKWLDTWRKGMSIV